MLTRRRFFIGSSAATGALVLGWSILPPRQRLLPDEPLTVAPGQTALNGWVKIRTDNGLTIIMAAAEMGQGIFTALAMLLIDELDADWGQVKLEQAGYDGIYNSQAQLLEILPWFKPDDEGWLRQWTHHFARKLVREAPVFWNSGASSGLIDKFVTLREAGASARAMLVAAAAARWDVPVSQCRTEAGRVLHASGKSASFGELAEHAARLPLPRNVTLKSSADFKLIGKPIRRIDTAGKLDGSPVFGIDALPEGLLYATIKMCPTIGGRVQRFSSEDALALPGVRKIVAIEPVAAGGLGGNGMTSGGVAVIAEAPFQAMRALEMVDVTWDHGSAADLSSPRVFNDIAIALDADAGTPDQQIGDVGAALRTATQTITAEYHVPFLAHATMEPMNCTVQFKNGAATVWAGLQGVGQPRNAVAKALGIDKSKVEIRLAYLGGGFGRRTFTDFVVQAALLARETDGAPVQLLWSREQDMTHDYYRPAYVARYQAGLDAAGNLTAWQVTSCGTKVGLSAPTSGSATTAYAFPSARVAHLRVDTAVPTGIWRGVNHSQNAFFTESFIDECAAAAGRDPVTFRSALLRGNGRHLRVLERAAELSSWEQPLGLTADGRRQARGIALHRCFGSVVAQVAKVSIGRSNAIRVHRVVCVVDCGFAVNPNFVRQQMEGAAIFGLSAALHGEITIAQRQVQQTNFHDYAPLRMDECPDIEVDIVDSGAELGGIGEVGTPAIAAAVANAVFALTGQRLRQLPLKLV